jgi:hypothetical protein
MDLRHVLRLDAGLRIARRLESDRLQRRLGTPSLQPLPPAAPTDAKVVQSLLPTAMPKDWCGGIEPEQLGAAVGAHAWKPAMAARPIARLVSALSRQRRFRSSRRCPMPRCAAPRISPCPAICFWRSAHPLWSGRRPDSLARSAMSSNSVDSRLRMIRRAPFRLAIKLYVVHRCSQGVNFWPRVAFCALRLDGECYPQQTVGKPVRSLWLIVWIIVDRLLRRIRPRVQN